MILLRHPGESTWQELWTMEAVLFYLQEGNDFEVPIRFNTKTGVQEVVRYTATREMKVEKDED